MRKTTAAWVCGLAALAGLLAAARPAWAWHGRGHERATRLAIAVLPGDFPRFFVAGAGLVAHCAHDPDLFTKPVGPDRLHKTESSEHYFDLERLDGQKIPDLRYDLLAWCVKHGIPPHKLGLVPYAIAEWTQRLTVAFAEYRRWPGNRHIQLKTLVYAGILAHYAQDLCQPLHTTIHYDGRARPDGSSPRSGIHLKVDALLEKLPAAYRPQVRPGALEPFDDLFKGILAELQSSHALVERVYRLEKVLPAKDQPLDADGPVAAFTR